MLRWRSVTHALTPDRTIAQYGYVLVDCTARAYHVPTCAALRESSPAGLGWTDGTRRARELGFKACRCCHDASAPSRGQLKRLLVRGAARRALEHLLCNGSVECEACGLLGGWLEATDQAVASSWLPLATSRAERDRFVVATAELRNGAAELERSGTPVIAMFHSHPEPCVRPSLRDRILVRTTGLPQLIVARRGAREALAACYTPTRCGIEPVEVVAERTKPATT